MLNLAHRLVELDHTHAAVVQVRRLAVCLGKSKSHESEGEQDINCQGASETVQAGKIRMRPRNKTRTPREPKRSSQTVDVENRTSCGLEFGSCDPRASSFNMSRPRLLCCDGHHTSQTRCCPSRTCVDTPSIQKRLLSSPCSS